MYTHRESERMCAIARAPAPQSGYACIIEGKKRRNTEQQQLKTVDRFSSFGFVQVFYNSGLFSLLYYYQNRWTKSWCPIYESIPNEILFTDKAAYSCARFCAHPLTQNALFGLANVLFCSQIGPKTQTICVGLSVIEQQQQKLNSFIRILILVRQRQALKKNRTFWI